LRNLIVISASIFLFLTLLGIIGGNSFLTILQRSFLGTLILSLLISGAFYIINKIISEISASDIGERQPEQDIPSDFSSNNVDIVLDKENPYETDEADILDNENKTLSSGSKSNGSSSVDELVEEVEEDDLGDIGSLEIKTNESEVIEVMSDNPNSMDSMPAIDSQTDIFGTDTTTAASKKENEILNSLGDNATPQIIAKAIKTVLIRDNNKG